MSALDQLWPDPDRQDNALMRLLRTVIANHHTPHQRLGRERPLGLPDDPLSKRERQTVLCLSHGLGRLGAADAMGVSVETVRVYSDRAKKKSRAKDERHLVAIALRNFWIR